MFKVHKTDRYFWGAEFLTKDGCLSIEDAHHRLRVYARIHNLIIDDSTISLDDTLMKALHTNEGSLKWSELLTILTNL
jgi:hypothetical protein